MSLPTKFRFSPSPSGFLHVGGARTAAFNWFLAKKLNACFLVRTEDTDKKRSTPESEKIILDSLRWLGLDWQEGVGVGGSNGPYRQSERIDIYHYYAEKLINEGKAYRCYCTTEELGAQRKALTDINPKAQFRYPGTCKNEPNDPTRPHVVRFVAPTTGTIEYDDVVFGHISTPNRECQDFVILRSDGQAMYNMAAVLDDHLMGVTDIVRGREHMSNSPLQIMLYNAFGWNPPRIASLPLMLDQTRAKLSKRTNSVSVFEYRDAGYSPSATLNYLSKFGWSFDGKQELFSINDLIEKFSLEACGRNDGCFDPKKFAAINHAHLKNETLTSNEEYAHRTLPFLYERGLADINSKQVESIVHLCRSKAKTYIEAANELDPILRKEITIDPEVEKKFITDTSRKTLNKYNAFLGSIDTWNEIALKENTVRWLTDNNLALKDIGQGVRTLITGRANSPELFQVMAALGKDITIERISRANG